MSYILRSFARPRLTAPDYDKDQAPRELIAKGTTYEDARDQLDEQLPAGWVLLGIDRYLEDGLPQQPASD